MYSWTLVIIMAATSTFSSRTTVLETAIVPGFTTLQSCEVAKDHIRPEQLELSRGNRIVRTSYCVATTL